MTTIQTICAIIGYIGMGFIISLMVLSGIVMIVAAINDPWRTRVDP